MSIRICIVPDCGRDTRKGARGYCGMHAARLRRGGHEHGARAKGELEVIS